MKKSINFQYQAQYSVSHEPTFQEKEIWLILHGYGQLAEFFIRKFQGFDSYDRLFVAPEATNYGYLRGFAGRVGANWMTKHERELAIENNHRFLDQLMEDLLSQYQDKPIINVLGFSQGGATATRWASRWSGKVDQLVLWAGGFAQDMELEAAREKFSKTKFTLVIGDQDEFVTPESIEIQQELTEKLEKDVKKLTFAGGHEIDVEMLSKILDSNE
ncbi:putative esterase [Algoriphagus ratkowskyi]|uniref:Alpha/beta hydrolase n=1 Tax=Algoriphagus ratkowskyi TaxID=57028 RepID=A0A2W7RKX2_9BACT|nr:alpha/beta fold hydrolase [Algoriphagus ratkowskyi]PZX59616.1 putative esterase [Algoriphagus ratkowskyi]TXD78662.1 alpha/beta hydrolase [Algoriphagus ratkowskyi]